MVAATYNFSSLLLLFLLSLFSTAFTSMHGSIDDPLIQQVVSSDGRDDLLTNAEHQFSAFKIKYGKTYPIQEEEDYRFGIFISNLRLARRNQIMDPTAVHGVTKFSDLTSSEFRRQYLGSGRQIQLPDYTRKRAPILPTVKLPDKMNWTKEGAVTAVKNQCVSKHPDVCNFGCEGGHRLLAYKYINDTGGVMKEEDYRFKGSKNNFCNVTNNSQLVASISEYDAIKPDEAQYATYLVKYGPLAVTMSIKTIQTYEKGVLCPPVDCSSPHVYNNAIDNHAVVLVGYYRKRTRYFFKKKIVWWNVKNSWGSDWGELGYFKVCGGLLTACVNKNPIATYVVAEKKKSS